MKSPISPLKKFVVVAMIAAGFTAFVLKLGLFFYWLSYGPTLPRPETGQIYPLNNHGHIFYVTQAQSVLQDCLMYAFLVFAFGGAILNGYWKVIHNPYNDLPKEPTKVYSGYPIFFVVAILIIIYLLFRFFNSPH
jgi:hypothetical protein